MFKGQGPVSLHVTWDGRQFGPSILAPFARVILEGGIGFVDGIIIAKSLDAVGGTYEVQLHGDAYWGSLECSAGEPSLLLPAQLEKAPLPEQPSLLFVCRVFQTWTTYQRRRLAETRRCSTREG